MKYLESDLVCVNVVSLPLGKQNDIAHEISERRNIQKREIYKIKIVVTTFMNMTR